MALALPTFGYSLIVVPILWVAQHDQTIRRLAHLRDQLETIPPVPWVAAVAALALRLAGPLHSCPLSGPGWLVADPSSEALHGLRKRIKRTRYCLEHLEPWCQPPFRPGWKI